ncbi:head completion/stabilization protein [Novosphingobium clariflavum]|uniref:Head completion/stabilization protein n=1 Tax=Novosphingobium clariflavum TaxID=2029884 RepID=A0ABV6S993_9SPHN|nr:head completion/stabilization protein [Novosphingobium clariflavum]
MTGLIAYPAPEADAPDAQVVADGWFPPVKLAAVRDVIRIGDGTVPEPRLTAAIEGGMLHAFRELSDWRSARAAEGAASLDVVTTDTINGRNIAVVLWERVVRYFAGAELFDQYRDISATDDGLDRAAEKDTAADDQRALALAAVADLRSIGADKPVPRNRVELI